MTYIRLFIDVNKVKELSELSSAKESAVISDNN